MTLRCKKIRSVCCQAAQSTANSAVHEPPVLAPLFEKIGVPVFDVGEAIKKKRFVDVSKKRNQGLDFFSAWQLWFFRQVATHDGFLMEQTKLNGQGWKQPFYQRNRAFSAIYRDAGERPSLRRQMTQALFGHRQSFGFHLLPVDVSSYRPINHQAVPSTKIGAVKGQGDRCFRHV